MAETDLTLDQQRSLSHHDPANAICSRMDLRTDGTGSANGCYDTKVTSSSMLRAMRAEALNGPTTNGVCRLR